MGVPVSFDLLQSFEPNTQGRDIVVGDIHGYYTRLMRSLRYINFDPKVDRLFACGDLIDRGHENEKILNNLLLEPWFHPVLGNHEQMLVEVAEMPEYDLRNDVELRKDIISNGGAWYLGLTRAERSACADLVSDLPLAIEILNSAGRPAAGIVHADVPNRSWSEFREVLLSGEVDRRAKKCCLWAKSADVVNHWFFEPVADIKHVFVGHNIYRPCIESPWEFLGLVRCDSGAWHPTTSEDCLFMLFDAVTANCLTPHTLWPDWTDVQHQAVA